MRKYLAVLVLAALVGCATPLETETNAMRGVTAARQSATALLRAGKISVADDQKAQTQLTAVANAIKAAVAVQDAPALAKAKADAAAIQSKLESK